MAPYSGIVSRRYCLNFRASFRGDDTECHIQNAFDELAKGRTTLIIDHRLSTIRTADRIVVVQDGLITETGSHEELMKVRGAYAELYRTQTEIYG